MTSDPQRPKVVEATAKLWRSYAAIGGSWVAKLKSDFRAWAQEVHES